MSKQTPFSKFFVWYRQIKYDLRLPAYSKIRGVTFSDRQGALAQSRKGDRLQLVHVPDNGFPYNVYVYSIELHRLLGYIDQPLAEKLVLVFGEGFCRDGEIVEVTGGPPQFPYFGCNIVIFKTMDMMNPYLE
jgi:hypothetical protein